MKCRLEAPQSVPLIQAQSPGVKGPSVMLCGPTPVSLLPEAISGQRLLLIFLRSLVALPCPSWGIQMLHQPGRYLHPGRTASFGLEREPLWRCGDQVLFLVVTCSQLFLDPSRFLKYRGHLAQVPAF